MLIVSALGTVGAVASCSSDNELGTIESGEDAGLEADTTRDDDAAPSDAGVTDADADAALPPPDAAPFDGGPLPIVCTSPPCATSLTTIFVPADTGRGEGFCALLDDGTVACWGINANGQLGRGDLVDSAEPQRVGGLTDIVAIEHSCALDKDGGVWCWGTGPFLRNDAGASTREVTPIKLSLPPVKHFGVGNDVACAVVDDGVLCWGANTNGQVAPFDVSAANTTLAPRLAALPDGAPIRDILVGKSVFVLREDGATLSWGASPSLGRVSSLNPDPQPLPAALSDISSMDLTSDTACATSGGVAYCWGRAIGVPHNFERKLPTPVATPEPVVQIATTRAFQTSSLGLNIDQPQRWCAVGASGDVYCWGFNGGGQAGDGTTKHALEPVKVQGLPAPAVEVRTHPDATCALLTNGKVHCWGTNYYGQLGNGKFREPSLVPQEVVLP